MIEAYIQYLSFIGGIILLIMGANYLVEGASSLAKRLGVSTIIIGLTIVAFGTSMPELVVNIVAASRGATEVAFGNIIGSNISNILLVLGITAIITNVSIKRNTTWKEIPFALLSVIVLFVVANKFMIEGIEIFFITRIDGIIMLLFFSIFIYYAFMMAKASKERVEADEIQIKKRNIFLILLMIIGGLIGLYFGGELTVNGAVFIAEQFGLSQFLISATIIAIGTSLPELVTSVIAAFKKNIDLAVGNVIGSNIFNIFWILGVTSIINPVPVPNFINFDILFLAISTILLFTFIFIGGKRELDRKEGTFFIILYLAYIIFLIIRG